MEYSPWWESDSVEGSTQSERSQIGFDELDTWLDAGAIYEDRLRIRSPDANVEYGPLLPPSRTMSQEQADTDDYADLRKRVRELIDENRELYDSLA